MNGKVILALNLQKCIKDQLEDFNGQMVFCFHQEAKIVC